jgi:hypothetical protein
VGDASVCPPLLYVGQCSDVCTHSVGSCFYDSCTWNGKTYQPITTRLTMSERYFCGDGVCQFTEHCGTGIAADSCKADCGLCP